MKKDTPDEILREIEKGLRDRGMESEEAAPRTVFGNMFRRREASSTTGIICGESFAILDNQSRL